MYAMLVVNIFNQPNPRDTTNDPMFSIIRFPTTCKPFLTKIRTILGKYSVSCRYVCEPIVAMAFLFDGRSMRNVSSLFGDRRSCQSYDKFLTRAIAIALGYYEQWRSSRYESSAGLHVNSCTSS